MKNSNTERQRAFKKRRKKAGMVRVEVWTLKQFKQQIVDFVKRLHA